MNRSYSQGLWVLANLALCFLATVNVYADQKEPQAESASNLGPEELSACKLPLACAEHPNQEQTPGSVSELAAAEEVKEAAQDERYT